MKNFFLALIFIVSSVFALDKNLLELEAKLYTKIILLDKDLKNKISKDKKIVINIIYDDLHKKDALYFKKILDNKKLHSYEVKVVLNKSIPKNTPTAYIIITSQKNAQKLLDVLKNKNRLIFSTKPSNICCSSVSIYVGPKIYPLLNPKILKETNIKLNPIIYKVARFYE